MSIPQLIPIPGGGRETQPYVSATRTMQLPAPERLPATTVVLPDLPATAQELVEMAASSLREPARCWTIAGSRDHIAALCGLVETLESALMSAARVRDRIVVQLATAEATAAAETTALKHENQLRVAAESALIARDVLDQVRLSECHQAYASVDAANNAHQVTALELEAARLRAEEDAAEIDRLNAKVRQLEALNDRMRERAISRGFSRFDTSDVVG